MEEETVQEECLSSELDRPTYHKLDYASSTQSYYQQGEEVRGEWRGELAASLGLSGEVSSLAFNRLAEGQHPETGEQLVKHRDAQEYKNPDGSTTKAVEHRAGWDAQFAPSKSVSLTALVGRAIPTAQEPWV